MPPVVGIAARTTEPPSASIATAASTTPIRLACQVRMALPSAGRHLRVGLASGSARSRRPWHGPRVIASRCHGDAARPHLLQQDPSGRVQRPIPNAPGRPLALPIGQARCGAGGHDDGGLRLPLAYTGRMQ